MTKKLRTRNFLWSNANNWSGGVVPGTGEMATIAGNPTIDAPATVGSLLMGGSGDYTISGEAGNVLTLDAASPIKNMMNALLTIDCDVNITAVGNIDTSGGKANNKMVFTSGKTLNVAANVNIRNYSDNTLEINCNLTGAANLTTHKGSASDVIFGDMADLSGFTGALQYQSSETGGYKMISNIGTSSGTGKLRTIGGVLKCNTLGGGTIEINGANTMLGTNNSNHPAGTTITIDLNAFQTIDVIKYNTASTLNLDMSDISALIITAIQTSLFNKLGILNFTGLQNNKITVGNSMDIDRLNQMTHDLSAEALLQDPVTDKLVESSVLSVAQDGENQNLIYPNPADNLVSIQANIGSEVRVFGTLIHDFISDEITSSIDYIPSGVYFVEISYHGRKTKTKLMVK